MPTFITISISSQPAAAISRAWKTFTVVVSEPEGKLTLPTTWIPSAWQELLGIRDETLHHRHLPETVLPRSRDHFFNIGLA